MPTSSHLQDGHRISALKKNLSESPPHSPPFKYDNGGPEINTMSKLELIP